MASTGAERTGIRLAGRLLLGGFVINAVATAFHPSGHENDHPKIFTDYAHQSGWEVIHLFQLLGVLTALAGLLVLCRLLATRGDRPVLPVLAAAATLIAGAIFAILQGLDGVGLKQAVDSWVSSSGSEKVGRFDNAETVRWLEWGFQSYFWVMFGASLALVGAGIVRVRLLAAWLGWLAIVAGALCIGIGVDVGSKGLESGFQDVVIPLTELALLVVAIGVLVVGARRTDPAG